MCLGVSLFSLANKVPLVLWSTPQYKALFMGIRCFSAFRAVQTLIQNNDYDAGAKLTPVNRLISKVTTITPAHAVFARSLTHL